MGLMAKAYRERRICIDEMIRKYPGLPCYESENAEVFRTIAFAPVYDPSTCPLDPYDPPKEENLKKAKELEEKYKANSNLSSLPGYFLYFLYEKEEAEYYSSHIDELISLNGVYKGSMHTIGFIASSLKDQNYSGSFVEDGRRLRMECSKKEIDTSDKYNPSVKNATYYEWIIPMDRERFIKELERRLKS